MRKKSNAVYVKKVEMDEESTDEQIWFPKAVVIDTETGTVRTDGQFLFTYDAYKKGKVTKIFKEDWNKQISNILEKME